MSCAEAGCAALAAAMRADARVVALGEDVGRGGIVRDEASRLRAVEKIRTFIETTGRRWLGHITSPITGRDGNVEFLAHLKP